MDERVLALCELSNDLLFHKIPRQELSHYVDSSLVAGAEAASLFAGQDIAALYKSHNIGITYSDSGKRSYGVMLRGQVTMSKTECSVEVYRESIEELARHSQWEGTELTYEQALQAHLAHEFFHFWEYQNDRSVAEELPGITALSFLGLHRKAQINRCSEVAAHKFAKELLHLPYLPNLYDYLYLMNTKKMERAAFEQLTSDMAALLL